MRYNPFSVTPDQISGLLSPFLANSSLAASQLQSISDYLALLMKWNARVNLTALRDPGEIIQRHFGESLFAASRLLRDCRSNFSVIDLGSGAGFPGLPLKIWSPGIRLTLIESNNKKAVFLREVVRALQFDSVEVLASRAESVDRQADLVTLRAVERFERALPSARRLMSPGAKLALLIGASQVELAKSSLLDLTWSAPVAIPLSQSRVLLVGRSSG